MLEAARGLILALAVLAPAQALAQPTQTSSVAEAPGFAWPEAYPRFRASEYVATTLLVAGNALSDVLWTGVDHEVWHGGILFDDAVRDAYANVPQGTRDALKKVGDYSLLGLVLFPFVVDSVGTALVAHGSVDAAWQTAMISMQSLLLSSLMNLLAKRYITRSRPGIRPCESGCQTPGYRSFYSGHAAQTFAGAGVICAHHAYLDLWGGGVADDLACATAVGLSVLTGVSRIIGDAHYTTDVLVGASVGFTIGFLLPAALHYRLGAEDRGPPVTAQVVPQMQLGGGGVAVVGRF